MHSFATVGPLYCATGRILHIAATELYPDDYDLDIVLETKENREKRKLLSRKHVEGLMIESPPEDKV
ncbi:hypothetical protein [Paenibacillus sp. NPDC055715]